jgi:predicted TIM-barrel fold metal-dependent hydrolase
LEIVDAHHHLWHSGLLNIPWLDGPKASFGDPALLRGPYRPAEYLKDVAPLNVVATVHLCTECLPTQAIYETMWLTGVADGCGLPSAIIASVDLEAPDFQAALDMHARSPLLRGVRYRLNYDEPSGRRIARSADMMDGQAFRDGLRILASRNLLFELSVFAPQLPKAAQLAAAVPEVTLALNQLGWPIAADRAAFEQWRNGMAALAKHRNVVVKIAGFWSIDREWREERIAPWVKETLSLFGSDRCLFGSSLPIEKLFCTVPRQVEILTNILSGEPQSVRDDIFRSTAARVYRLDLN